LFGGVGAVLAVGLYWPTAQALLKFGALDWQDLAVCAATGFASLFLLEFIKAKWFGATAGVVRSMSLGRVRSTDLPLR
jgi:hypothetical protein